MYNRNLSGLSGRARKTSLERKWRRPWENGRLWKKQTYNTLSASIVIIKDSYFYYEITMTSDFIQKLD